NVPDTNFNYCDFYNSTQGPINWTDKLVQLLDYKNNLGDRYKQIAIMFRSNDEVFRAFNKIQSLELPNTRIRIQGAKGALSKTREFFYFISILKSKKSETLPKNYIEELKSLKNQKEREHTNWDS